MTKRPVGLAPPQRDEDRNAQVESGRNHLARRFLTGVWLLSKLKPKVLSNRTAVIVLTNHHDFPTIDRLIDELSISRSLVAIRRKKEVKRRQLADYVYTRIAAAKNSTS